MVAFKKRSMERYSLELAAQLSYENVNKKKSSRTLKTRNICSGGAFLETAKPLPMGTHVTLQLLLPLDKLDSIELEQAQVAVSGEVIRIEKAGMAVRFDESYHITTKSK